MDSMSLFGMNSLMMTFCHKLAFTTALTALSLTIVDSNLTSVRAATFFESGDTGSFPFYFYSGYIQFAKVNGQTPDRIAGNFRTGDNVDLFKIDLQAGFFSASTSDGTVTGSRSLFLFDKNGLGLAAHTGNGTFAKLEGMLPTTDTYFLGIGGAPNYSWHSSSGKIFTASDYASSSFGATGPGANAQPNLIRFGPVSYGNYEIAIQNKAVKAVPEPASWVGLLGLGAWGASSYLKRKQRSNAC